MQNSDDVGIILFEKGLALLVDFKRNEKNIIKLIDLNHKLVITHPNIHFDALELFCVAVSNKNMLFSMNCDGLFTTTRKKNFIHHPPLSSNASIQFNSFHLTKWRKWYGRTSCDGTLLGCVSRSANCEICKQVKINANLFMAVMYGCVANRRNEKSLSL